MHIDRRPDRFRSLHCLIPEILSTEGISFFSLVCQEGEILHEHPPAEGAVHLNTIHITRVCSFDSILDSPHKKYTIRGIPSFR